MSVQLVIDKTWGIHLEHKVNPDIAIFGKALGSGFAINAIIGKKYNEKS